MTTTLLTRPIETEQTYRPYPLNTTSEETETERQLVIMESVKDSYTYNIRHFITWMREGNHSINFDTIRDYFAYLNLSGFKAAGIRIKRQAVISRLKMLFHDRPIEERMKLEMLLKDLNVGATRAPKANSASIGSEKVITPLEYERLLQGARSERQRLFLMFLWVTGCRVSEMTGIKLTDCETFGERVHIRIMGKGSKERYIWIPTCLYSLIRKTFTGTTWLMATGTGKRYDRSYISNQIAKLGRFILNRRISAHTFRHSFATRKIKETAKIQAVSQYLGHSSVAITLSLYCHESLSAEDLSSETDLIGMVA